MTGIRMLIGTRNIGNNVQMFAQGFRELGFEVQTANTADPTIYYDESFDLNARDLHQEAMRRIEQGQSPDVLADDPRYAHFFDFDLYIFVSCHSLFPGMLDVPLLKERGKAIISFHGGSELRYWRMAEEFNAAYGHTFPDALKSNLVNFAEDVKLIASVSRYAEVFANKLHNTRVVERYCDMVMTQPRSNVLGVRPYMAAIVPVDTARCRPNIPGREVPVVVHAPTSPEFKRSDLILAALDRLWSEGVAFELRLLRNVPNEQVLAALSDCDVLIDQIACGKTGLLGYEGMASGCTVLGCNDEGAHPVPFRCQPILRIAPDNVYDVLKRVLTDRELRIRTAEAGLRFVGMGLQTPARVAAYMLECLERTQKGDHDYYPAQFLERPRPPRGEVVPDYLKGLTWEVMALHGVPPDADFGPVLERGLLPDGAAELVAELPRWRLDGATRHFWGWQGPNATWPHRRGDGGPPEAGEPPPG